MPASGRRDLHAADNNFIGSISTRTTIRIGDPAVRQWFVDVIKAKAHAGHDLNREHAKEFARQREQINAKL